MTDTTLHGYTIEELLRAAFKGELGEETLLYILRAILDTAGTLGVVG